MKIEIIAVILLVVGIILVVRYNTMSSADPVISVPDDDKEMATAIQKARETLPSFISILQTPDPEDRHLLVKARFVEGRHSEHMWVADLSVESNGFHGVLADEPQFIKGLRFKQPVTVTHDQISDWMIVKNGKVTGAFTARVLRNRMNAKERKVFDQNMPYTFE